MSIYRLSDLYAAMSEQEFMDDLENFYHDYITKNRIDDIVKKEVQDVYSLYICRYIEYKDKDFDITLN